MTKTRHQIRATASLDSRNEGTLAYLEITSQGMPARGSMLKRSLRVLGGNFTTSSRKECSAGICQTLSEKSATSATNKCSSPSSVFASHNVGGARKVSGGDLGALVKELNEVLSA
jgi:hypothetical protein